MKFGLNEFDCALGGIGGSPFIKGSTGNIATEETICMLESRGFSTSIDIEKVAKISRWLENKIDESCFGGKLYKQITVENIST